MVKALTNAREDLADSAPKITTLKIPVDKIRDIIGPGGKIIREICEETGAKIDIEEDGTVKVAVVSGPSGEAAVARIRDIVAEPELGVIYDGKVVKTVDFGAFVNFLGAKDGWCIFLNCKMAAPKDHGHLPRRRYGQGQGHWL